MYNLTGRLLDYITNDPTQFSCWLVNAFTATFLTFYNPIFVFISLCDSEPTKKMLLFFCLVKV